MANENGTNDQSSVSSPLPNGGSGVQHSNPSQQKWAKQNLDDDDASSQPSYPNQRATFNAPTGYSGAFASSGFRLDGGEAGEFISEGSAGEEATVIGGVETAIEMAELNEEVANSEGQETSEEVYEASAEQMSESESAQELTEEGLFESVSSNAGGLVSEVEELQEAGTGIEQGLEAGQEEFFPIIAAMVPTLLSAIGPTVAKKVLARLSPLARQGIKRLAASAFKPGKKTRKAGRSILNVFARLLESAQYQTESESGAELSEELTTMIDEAALAAEIIIGTDDRVLFTNTTAVPHRQICELKISFPNGKTVRGTGFLIGQRTVATAGHCIYMHAFGGWARRVEVIPASNSGVRPFGSAIATSFRSVRGWVNAKKPECDYGCIVLPTGAFGGRNLGKFGFAAFHGKQLMAKRVYLKGYPGDKPSQLWGMARRVKTVTAKTLIYDIDTVGGQSGAPLYLRMNNKRYVVGIHNYGNAGGNSATRLTPAVCERLKRWSAL